MFKNVIAPVQAWLLSRNQCVVCGLPLDQAKKQKASSDKEKITCKCGRIFIFDTKLKKYRRALFEEI